jgi:hypothetical protein
MEGVTVKITAVNLDDDTDIAESNALDVEGTGYLKGSDQTAT